MKNKNDIIISNNPDDIIALKRMRNVFQILYGMTESVALGVIKGMVVFGPPGVGKSHNVMAALDTESILQSDFSDRYSIISGYMTTVNLYMLLYKYRHSNNVIVLDDIDSVFASAESLNLLKAALDTTETRNISYMAQSIALAKNGVPKSFEFKGGIILITNINFSHYKGKNKAHLDAIVSRCHYLDLSIDTAHEKMLWLKEIVVNGDMLKGKLSSDESMEVINFIENNSDSMRELSLRMISKIADLMISNKTDWRTIAEITCMK